MKEHLLNKDDDEDNVRAKDLDVTNIFTNEYNELKGASEAYFKDNIGSIQKAAEIFKTNLKYGLNSSDENDLKMREERWGNNKLPPEKPNSILEHILNCFDDLTLQILLAASIVSLIIGVSKDGIKTGWIEGTAIFFAVFIVVAISSYMNYDEREQFLKLSRETKEKKVMVIRDGKPKQISMEDLLVGDILQLALGDIVNVDGFIFKGEVQMDESPVTGESDPMAKAPIFQRKGDKASKYICPFVFSGSQVLDGQGQVLVAAVGSTTFEGRNKQLMESSSKKDDDEEDKEMTPLMSQLNRLTVIIGYLGFSIAIAIGVLMVIKCIVIKILYNQPIFDQILLDVSVNAFIISVTVIVVAIPEGLPMAVTIALAYSVESMKDEHNLVKHLDKSEAMGNVNNVCTDKTGTLTKGEMKVVKFFIEGTDIGLKTNQITDIKQKELLYNCIYRNITCTKLVNDKGQNVLKGDMTEKALYRYLDSNDYDLNAPKEPAYILPFNSEYKYMSTIYKDGEGYILYWKGAYERAKLFMKKFRISQEEEDDFSDHESELEDAQVQYAEDSIRTLIFGYKRLTEGDIKKAKEVDPEIKRPFFENLAEGLTFAFMVGIRDDNREEVPKAILDCHTAGITVRMVTGDNITTALAISKDVHIIERDMVKPAKALAAKYRERVDFEANPPCIKKGYSIFDLDPPTALEGEVFRVVCGNLSKETNPTSGELEISLKNKDAFKHVTKNLLVIARASPEDKFILVHGLKSFGNIVAVTGDGTNDAPALKQAHVGFAMGIRGTDIAKDAADIILLDDSFSSIVTACKYGRNVYDCIRKFVQFQLTTNIVAVFMTFMGGIILKDSPLNAIQMLWVNLIMDSFASLALATEKPNDSLLKRPPYSRESSIITPMMMVNIVSQAIFQIITLSIIIFYGDVIFGVPSDRELEHFIWNNVNGYHFTIFFNIFVYMQVLNSINARKLQKNEYNVFSGILGNWYYIFIQSFIIFGQIVLTTFGGRAVRTHPLSIYQHLACFGIASITIVGGFFVKLLPFDAREDLAQYTEENARKAEVVQKKVESIGFLSRGGTRFGKELAGNNLYAGSRVRKSRKSRK